ncbi:hypothetical protein Bca52824_033163 [Brassica carinata]|uniref:Uncharacterized protein n=1 Tax=Brassica carinata TaxID=52824 RepID=A0A8X7SEH6_BRACI|nr:hypothetical protein Bca52824_033163 [Brassica carinata]
MHPPDLKLMETENGRCNRGASYSVKGKEIGNNISEVTGSQGIVDEDLVLLRHVEALEASYGGDSGTTKPVNEKSTDNQHRGESVEVGCVVIPGSDNLPQQTCNERDKGMSYGDDMVVDRGKSKDNAKAACVGVVEEKGNSNKVDIQETCQEIVVDRGKSKGDATEAGFRVMVVEKEKVKGDDNGEDEDDDFEYDFNWWHDYVRNDCVTDDDKDDNGGPVIGGSGGESAPNGHHSSGMRGQRAQGFRRPEGYRGR